MKVVKIDGQLGRQMFQYAFFIALSETYGGNDVQMTGRQLLLQSVFKLTHSDKFHCKPAFNLPWKNNPYKGFSIIHEPADYSYAPQLINEVPDNSIFEGGWYSYRYFSNVEEEILRQFNFISPIHNELANIIPTSENDETVALHVINPNKYPNASTRDYYNWAIANINTFVPQPRYFLLTDDIKWSQKNLVGLPNDYTFINTKKIPETLLMQTMSMASHVVASATLNDWWAAYLNANPDKIVIVPKRWNLGGTIPTDLLPIHWTAIPLT